MGDHVGAIPVDRGEPGEQTPLVCDGAGLPLTVVVIAAIVNDTAMFEAVRSRRSPHLSERPAASPYLRFRPGVPRVGYGNSDMRSEQQVRTSDRLVL